MILAKGLLGTEVTCSSSMDPQ